MMLKDILEVCLLIGDRESSIFQSENETSWEGGSTVSEL